MLYPEGSEHDMNVQKEAAIKATEQLDDVDDEGGRFLDVRHDALVLRGYVCGLFR